MFGRAVVAVVAVAGLFALGHQDAAPDRGPMIVRPATEVEKLTHDVRHAWEIDQVDGPNGNGWGAD